MYRGADARGVSAHHDALEAIAFLFDGCFVLTTPNEIIAHTLHFVSWLGSHRVY
jgi:transcriptional antiterminator